MRIDQSVSPAEAVKRNHAGSNPGDDRQRLAHKAARKGENRRQGDNADYREIEQVHGAVASRCAPACGPGWWPGGWMRRRGAGDKRATSSLKCPTGTLASPSVVFGALRARAAGRSGVQASAK